MLTWKSDLRRKTEIINKRGAFFYFEPLGEEDSFYEYVRAPLFGVDDNNFKNFRIKNDADNYELSCSIVVREPYVGSFAL